MTIPPLAGSRLARDCMAAAFTMNFMKGMKKNNASVISDRRQALRVRPVAVNRAVGADTRSQYCRGWRLRPKLSRRKAQLQMRWRCTRQKMSFDLSH
jgi:hypothetical protein